MLRELQLIDDTDSGTFHVLSINTVVQLSVKTVKESNRSSKREEAQRQPEDFVQYPNDVPSLNLTNTTPEHVLKIIKS
jgi:hypothetical protein